MSEGSDRPENLPTRMSSVAASKRTMSRSTSEYQLANLNPKVMGSAWTPWGAANHRSVFEFPRPLLRTSDSRRRSAAMMAEACAMSRAWAVSHDVVRSQAVVEPSRCGPTNSDTAVVKAMTSWRTSASIWLMRSSLKSALLRMALAASFGTIPASARVSVAAISTFSQVPEAVFFAPDAAHVGADIAWNQGNAFRVSGKFRD